MHHCLLFIVQISFHLLYRLLDCSHVTVNIITTSGKPLTVRAKWHLYVRDLHHLTSISRMWDDGCMPGEDTQIHRVGVTLCRWGEVVSMEGGVPLPLWRFITCQDIKRGLQYCEAEYLFCGGLLQSSLHGCNRLNPQTQTSSQNFLFQHAGFTRVSLDY